jgi:hypothetical protein
VIPPIPRVAASRIASSSSSSALSSSLSSSSSSSSSSPSSSPSHFAGVQIIGLCGVQSVSFVHCSWRTGLAPAALAAPLASPSSSTALLRAGRWLAGGLNCCFGCMHGWVQRVQAVTGLPLSYSRGVGPMMPARPLRTVCTPAHVTEPRACGGPLSRWMQRSAQQVFVRLQL